MHNIQEFLISSFEEKSRTRMPQELYNSSVYYNAYGLVKSYVLQRSGNDEDVRDTLQEGFFIYFNMISRQEIDLDCKLESYIFGICKNVWKKELKNRNGEVLVDAFDEFEDYFGDEVKSLEKKEVLHSILKRNISKLSPRCQQVINLRLEGYTCDQIADQMGFDSDQITRNKTYTCKTRLNIILPNNRTTG